MPYIGADIRDELTPTSKSFAGSSGLLTYQITVLVNQYIYMMGKQSPGYDILSEAIGALECAKLELYRRILAPYEDKKLAENGDVYGPDQTDL